MISREVKEVQLIYFTPGKDEKGKIRQVVDNERTATIEMVIKPYKQTVNSDVRFTDTTDIGLTLFQNITSQNQIQFGDQVYNVLYVIPSNRYNQVFLNRV